VSGAPLGALVGTGQQVDARTFEDQPAVRLLDGHFVGVRRHAQLAPGALIPVCRSRLRIALTRLRRAHMWWHAARQSEMQYGMLTTRLSRIERYAITDCSMPVRSQHRRGLVGHVTWQHHEPLAPRLLHSKPLTKRSSARPAVDRWHGCLGSLCVTCKIDCGNQGRSVNPIMQRAASRADPNRSSACVPPTRC